MTTPEVRVPEAVAVLEPFVAAGSFGPGDVQLAATVARLSPGLDERVLLAVACASRAPALGHVGIELASVAERLLDRRDQAPPDLPWPELDGWVAALQSSPVVAGPDRAREEPLPPLVWDGGRVYLQRYWTYEAQVAADLHRRAFASPPAGSFPADGLDALFPPSVDGAPNHQRVAVEVALANRISVIAGGPGTGKTRTIARLLAALERGAPVDGRAVEVALAAPTGKAAARMTEAVHQAVAEGRADGVIDDAAAERLLAAEATTIHALLGWRPGVRFRHGRLDPLPHDLVIVDETSMISLPLVARLLEAVRPEATLVLVGDPDQLASVDAGTVLADLVGGPARVPDPAVLAPAVSEAPAVRARRRSSSSQPDAAERLFDLAEVDIGAMAPPSVDPRPATGAEVVSPIPAPLGATAESASAAVGGPTPGQAPGGVAGEPLRGRVTVLDRVHRFGAGSGIAELADAVRRGDAAGAIRLLDGARPDLRWARPGDRAAADTVGTEVVLAAVDAVTAARAGDPAVGLAAAFRVKVLAATRRGDGGLDDWTARIEAGVRAAVPDLHDDRRWYVGRPVLVTANDRVNALANGDVGLVVDREGASVVALPQGPDVRFVPVSRLHDVETWWAMTIHKSQGSEFPHVVVSLPEAGSPILTRELLYTAVTRAKERVTIVASEAALRTAIETPVARASGLGPRLWPSS